MTRFRPNGIYIDITIVFLALLSICCRAQTSKDWQLPIRDGKDLLAAIRNISEGARLTLQFPRNQLINASGIPLPAASSAVDKCALEFIGAQEGGTWFAGPGTWHCVFPHPNDLFRLRIVGDHDERGMLVLV